MPIFLQMWMGPVGFSVAWHFALRDFLFLLACYSFYAWIINPGAFPVVAEVAGRITRYFLGWGL